MASESGADLEAVAATAATAGLDYVHLPFNTPSSPGDEASGTVREFPKVTSDPANRPLFVHCAGADRAAAMWTIKWIVVDEWAPASPALVWARGHARTYRP